jgi:hypothetical protein
VSSDGPLQTSAQTSAQTGTQIDTQIDADAPLPERIAAAVLAVPGVHGLHETVVAGVVEEVAARLPVSRVAGVQLKDDECTVRVVLDHDAQVVPTSEAVHRALAPLVERPVHLVVEDIATP